MRKLPLLLGMAAALLSLPAMASISVYQAILNGPSESPANASPGTGFATVTWDDVAHTMHVQVSFTGLTGATTASHIHAPTVDPLLLTAGVATTTPTFAGFPLGVTSGTYDNTLDMTAASSYNPAFVTANGGSVPASEAALKAAIDAQKSYLNIHTQTFGGGEIRGFLIRVPEPASLALLGVGGALMLRRRR